MENKTAIIAAIVGVVAAAVTGFVVMSWNKPAVVPPPTQTNSEPSMPEIARDPQFPPNATVVVITGEAPTEPTLAAIRQQVSNGRAVTAAPNEDEEAEVTPSPKPTTKKVAE